MGGKVAKYNWKFAGFSIGILSIILWFMTTTAIKNQKISPNLYMPALLIEWILPPLYPYLKLKNPERSEFLSGQSAAFVIGICIVGLYSLVVV